MKKILFIGLVLLALLLVLPGAVSAAEADIVTVSGSITGYIDVSVTAESLGFGAMTVAGSPYTQSTPITVTSSFPSWGVDVTGTNSGYMTAGSTPLATAFLLGKDGSGYQTLPITDYMTGSAGATTATVNARQSVVVADPVGNYAITVTFTGGSN